MIYSIIFLFYPRLIVNHLSSLFSIRAYLSDYFIILRSYFFRAPYTCNLFFISLNLVSPFSLLSLFLNYLSPPSLFVLLSLSLPLSLISLSRPAPFSPLVPQQKVTVLPMGTMYLGDRVRGMKANSTNALVWGYGL